MTKRLMQNLDGIKKPKLGVKITSSTVVVLKPQINFDDIVRRRKLAVPQRQAVFNVATSELVEKEEQRDLSIWIRSKNYLHQFHKLFSNISLVKIGEYFAGLKNWISIQKRFSVAVMALAIILAFSGGFWATLATPKSSAENETPAPVGAPVALDSENGLGPINTVSNDALFNMTIGQLESYLNSLADSSKKMKFAEQLELRKKLLKVYLLKKNSAFAEASDVIAEQEHWKLILAISFAESTWGRNCVDNNCSNIGVKPGHPAWRKYASIKDWVIDFNRLLEKKYKNWSLEQMNGVYVQPKNPNWLLATRQVLQDLQEQGIE